MLDSINLANLPQKYFDLLLQDYIKKDQKIIGELSVEQQLKIKQWVSAKLKLKDGWKPTNLQDGMAFILNEVLPCEKSPVCSLSKHNISFAVAENEVVTKSPNAEAQPFRFGVGMKEA